MSTPVGSPEPVDGYHDVMIMKHNLDALIECDQGNMLDTQLV